MSFRVSCLAVGTLVFGSGTALGQGPLDERKQAARDGTVKISSAAGSVHVMGWNRDTVAVTGTLGPGADLEFQSGNRETRIRIAVQGRDPPERVPPSDIVVRVPRQSSVAVRTVAAAIEISGVNGSADVESQTGDIRVSGSVRTVYAESAGGNVQLDVSTKVARAKTVDGDITVRGARGYLDVSTVSGTAHVMGREVWETEMTSVSGDITFEGSFSREGTLYVESHSGTIELVLPSNQGADFDIVSVTGNVENSFSRASGPTFSIGGGGTQVKIKSFKGLVRIRSDERS